MELILFLIGGLLYYFLEILWRGYSHWTMFILGGICFVIMGLLNEYKYTWEMPFWKQCFVSANIITVFEFFTGCIVNICLKWDVWDYSDIPFNFMGQICLRYYFLWIILSAIGIVCDDWIRYGTYKAFYKYFPDLRKREKPKYF